jgi:hypothetical protein
MCWACFLRIVLRLAFAEAKVVSGNSCGEGGGSRLSEEAARAW